MGEEALDNMLKSLREARKITLKVLGTEVSYSSLNRQILGRILRLLTEALDISRDLRRKERSKRKMPPK